MSVVGYSVRLQEVHTVDNKRSTHGLRLLIPARAIQELSLWVSLGVQSKQDVVLYPTIRVLFSVYIHGRETGF